MKPTARQLHGWSLEDAECMGKPHFGARYLSDDPMNMTRYTRDIGHHCAICGRDSTKRHLEAAPGSLRPLRKRYLRLPREG